MKTGQIQLLAKNWKNLTCLKSKPVCFLFFVVVLARSNSLAAPKTAAPRPPTHTSIPVLLQTLQNEWDALVLETFALKQQYNSTRQELSYALYNNDAAARVVARLVRERDAARE